MPPYEFTFITKSLAKNELVTTLKRAAKCLLDKGAVIERVESLGHRDLPFRRTTKIGKEPVYTTNYFLMHTHLPITAMHEVGTTLKNDKDLLHVYAVAEHTKGQAPEECNLPELMLSPAYRKSVEDLRKNQSLGHFQRFGIYKKTEAQWRAVPKSYFIAPHRK